MAKNHNHKKKSNPPKPTTLGAALKANSKFGRMLRKNRKKLQNIVRRRRAPNLQFWSTLGANIMPSETAPNSNEITNDFVHPTIVEKVGMMNKFGLESTSTMNAPKEDSTLITSKSTNVDFDPESLFGGNTVDVPATKSFQGTIEELDAIMAENAKLVDEALLAVNETAESNETEEVGTKFQGDFLLITKAKRKFGFKAEIIQTTFYNSKLLYKVIMPLNKALRLQSFYASCEHGDTDSSDYGIRLQSLLMKDVGALGSETYVMPIPRSKKSKKSTYRFGGIEIKKNPGLKSGDAVVTVLFSPNYY